jgi:hypothetical protein
LGSLAHSAPRTGNWDYWLEYLKVSKVLVTGKDGEVKLRDNCCFVFGGDTFGQPCARADSLVVQN